MAEPSDAESNHLEQKTPSWKRMYFKTHKVWLATDSMGKPIVKNNKVLIKYQLNQEHEYWVYPDKVTPRESTTGIQIHATADTAGTNSVKIKPQKKNSSESNDPVVEKNAIRVFTDGASSGNPGPSGIGVIVCCEEHSREISRYIGFATNNIAELEAIRVGLSEIKKTERPVRVFTDSGYAYGVLTLGWKAQKNKELIKSIQDLISSFTDIRFIKVKGHSGMIENERADTLATAALRTVTRQDA